jgi:apolipoprotein N-acyltransferase
VEFRIPVVRATNSGIGAVVTAAGELDGASITPLFEQCTVAATVVVPQITTLYSKTGDLFLWVCALGSLILLGADIRKRLRFYHREMKGD